MGDPQLLLLCPSVEKRPSRLDRTRCAIGAQCNGHTKARKALNQGLERLCPFIVSIAGYHRHITSLMSTAIFSLLILASLIANLLQPRTFLCTHMDYLRLIAHTSLALSVAPFFALLDVDG